MVKFKHQPPRTNSGDLRTPVTFYAYEPNTGPEPGEKELAAVYKCFARVDKVWLKDMEQAKANGTLEDVTVTIRDPGETFLPTNLHHLSIDDRHYNGRRYNIKTVQPDAKDRGFINVIGGAVR